MKTIGLITAMKLERDALLHHLTRLQRLAIGTFRGNSFIISGQTCVLLTSGMGVRRASDATVALIEKYSPHLLISFGIAGSVNSDLAIGDVVLVDAVCQLDQGVREPMLTLMHWPQATHPAILQAVMNRGAHLFSGTAVTTSGSQINSSELEEIRNPILEMETVGIARVAVEKGIPFLSLRAISDGPAAPLPFDLGKMMDEDANLLVTRLLSAIVHNPSILFQSRRLLQNSRLAAANAAIALLAALSQAAFFESQGESIV